MSEKTPVPEKKFRSLSNVEGFSRGKATKELHPGIFFIQKQQILGVRVFDSQHFCLYLYSLKPYLKNWVIPLIYKNAMDIVNYQSLLEDIKSRIRSAQVKAALAVNSEMILLYWQIGKTIAERQVQEGWSSKVIPRLAIDLKNEFAELKGYSERNLSYMLRFANEYPDAAILQQVVAKLPWGHNILLFEKIKDQKI